MNFNMPKYTETTDAGFLCVSKLGSGWAAIHMVNVTKTYQDGSTSSYSDIQQTGVGRYRTKLEAVYEAREWSESDQINFDEPKDED